MGKILQKREKLGKKGAFKKTKPKGKLFLFQWEKESATTRAAALTKDGWEVEMEFEEGSAPGSKKFKAFAPDVAAFDLAQKPSHSREVRQGIAQF